MDKNKLMYSLLSLSLLLEGCSSTSQKEKESESTKKENEAEELVWVDLNQEIKQDNISNSIQLFDLLCSNQSGNQLFSPLSLNFALGMLSEGANGTTREQIDQYLNTDNFENYAAYYLNYIKENYNSGTATTVEITNGLFMNKNFDILDSYTKKIQSYYQGETAILDFSNSAKSARYINDWCNNKTHSLIPDLISPEDIFQDLSMILTNSLYFESSWSNPWNAGGMLEEFTNIDSSTTNLEYIYNSGDQYFENEYATAFGKHYQNGISFIGILPKKEGDFQLSELDLVGLLESEQTATQIDIKMPRLNYDSSYSLNEELQQLGIQDAFNNADFSNLSLQSTLVSKVIQKTKIELDEYGTKAASATMTMNKFTSYLHQDPIIKEVYLNRPFAYLIYDENQQQILFIGKVLYQ